jgi:hypothetical protein
MTSEAHPTAHATPWYELRDSDFAVAAPEDDFLHPAANALVADDSATETQYFGFNIPEQDIQAVCYLWHHPNLKVVTGGLWVWKGEIRHIFQSEIFDFVVYDSDRCLDGDLHCVELSNGYRCEVIEPLRRHRVSYRDEARGHALDVEFEATMPAVLTRGGLHLDQGMHARGTLTVAGETHPIDCLSVRDRSWGAVRPEAHTRLPPASWTCCVFSEDFAISYFAFDSLDTDPEWKDHLAMPYEDNLLGGWLWKDGELTALTKLTQRTEHDFETLFPTAVTATFTDSKGRTFDLRGDITNAGNWHIWMNFDGAYCGARFECDGHVATGDFQEVQGIDYVKRFRSKPL